MKKALIVMLLSILFNLVPAYAVSPTASCHGQWVNPLKDIDWNGLYPITIGSSDATSGSLPDTDNPGNPICVCEYDPFPEIGLSMGYWEPMALVDVTRTPYCLVNLGGQQVNSSSESQEGTSTANTADNNTSFYEVHYYNYPILQLIAGYLLSGSCITDGSYLMPSYFSELDPTWHDEKLAAIAFPETQLFENPAMALGAQAACAADALKANTGLPLDTPFWCMGNQGFLYPMTGEVSGTEGSVQASTLLSERVVAKLHALGLISDTDAGDLCNETLHYNLPKSRYRYQMVYPTDGPAKPFGRSTALWETGVVNPLKGDDAGYLIFRKRNCCNY